jgi:hypothetical protein
LRKKLGKTGMVLVGLTVVVILTALLTLTVHVASMRSSGSYKAQLKAAGEQLEVVELLPPTVSPDKNGAPVFRQVMALFPWGNFFASNPPPAMRLVAPGRAMVGWQQPDIRGADGTNTWEEAGRVLNQQRPVIELLEQLPNFQTLDFEIKYQNGFDVPLPHLSKLKGSAQLLSAAVVCDLQRGDTGGAVADSRALHALIEEWAGERLVISSLVRMMIINLAVGADWELLQSPRVTDEQLAGVQQDWQRLEVVHSTENAMLMERAVALVTVAYLRTSNDLSSAVGGSGSGGSSSGGYDSLSDFARKTWEGGKRRTAQTMWRVSWSYDDEQRILEGHQVLLQSLRQIGTNGYFFDTLDQADRKLNVLLTNWSSGTWNRVWHEIDDDNLQYAFSQGVFSLERVLDRVLRAEITRRVAITAIALKRYQLRHGEYPADLSALVPEILPAVPADPVDGKPLRYRRSADGTFVLYSIGYDGKDDGGDGGSPSSARLSEWVRGRDSVWPQPATPAEIEFYEQQERLNRN